MSSGDYSTFKPTVLSDSTHSFRNNHFLQPNRSTVKLQKPQDTDLTKETTDYQHRLQESKKEIEELKSMIEGQNHFIKIMRNSLEQKIKAEDLEEILAQVLNMSRDQRIDIFVIVSQLYQELQQSNNNNNQVHQLQLLIDNLNQQIQCYAAELMELKVDKQCLLDQIAQKETRKQEDELKQSKLQRQSYDNEQWKQKYQVLELQFDRLLEEKNLIEKRFNKIHNSLRTEECEKEELIKEIDQLKQVYYRSQVQEVHKLELNLALKHQEIDYLEAKNQKSELRNKELTEQSEELHRAVATLKYQIETLQQQHQIQTNQMENDMIKLKTESDERAGHLLKLESELQVQEQFISQIISELQGITGSSEMDVFKLLNLACMNLEKVELEFRKSEQEKSQMIFDLQCRCNDAENQNQKQSEMLTKMEGQVQHLYTEIKALEKSKRIFRVEYNHLKQLNEQRKQEVEQLQAQFIKVDKRLQIELEKNIVLEREMLSLKDQLMVSQQQQNQLLKQSTLCNKKNMSMSMISIDQRNLRQDYQALLQTFEKIKPLFSEEALDLVEQMLKVQTQLVTETVDSSLLQEEMKIQQKIQLFNMQNLALQSSNTKQEDSKLQKNFKGSLSVHFKPKVPGN